MNPQELRALVLHQDADMLVIDKPAGLAVHGGPSTTEHLEGMLGALTYGWRHPPSLVHRLDRDTSGCLVLARHDKAVRKLGRLFAAGAVEKTYWAVVEGIPKASEGIIDLALRKLNRKDGWRMVADPNGQRAETHYRVLGTSSNLAWLELKPRTGRTHQIRVHCAALGFPVKGDPVYGNGVGQMHLHARAVLIPALSPSKQPVAVIAKPPAHMLAALRALGFGF